MNTSKASAALWDHACKQTSARHGLPGSDPADAITKVVTIPQLIKSIGTDPNAIELLAARAHELSPSQRTAVLRAHGAAAPKAKPKAKAKPTKAAPKATPPTLRGMAGISLWGKQGAPS